MADRLVFSILGIVNSRTPFSKVALASSSLSRQFDGPPAGAATDLLTAILGLFPLLLLAHTASTVSILLARVIWMSFFSTPGSSALIKKIAFPIDLICTGSFARKWQVPGQGKIAPQAMWPAIDHSITAVSPGLQSLRQQQACWSQDGRPLLKQGEFPSAS
jgi:hypothetical protein